MACAGLPAVPAGLPKTLAPTHEHGGGCLAPLASRECVCRYGYRWPCTNRAFQQGQTDLCEPPPVPFRGAACSDAAGAQFCYAEIEAAVRRGAAGASSSSKEGSGSGRSGQAAAGTGAAAAAAAAPAPDELVCGPPGYDQLQEAPFTHCRLAADPPDAHGFQASAPAGSCTRWWCLAWSACAWWLQRRAVTRPLPAPQVWYDTPHSLRLKYGLAAQMGLRGVGAWHLDCLDYACTDRQCAQATRAMWAALGAFTGQPAAAAVGAGAAAQRGGSNSSTSGSSAAVA